MTEAYLPRIHLKYPQISSLQQEHFHFFYEATLLPLHSTTKITTTEALDGKKYFLLWGKVKKIFQTLKTIKSLIHKKIIVPL